MRLAYAAIPAIILLLQTTAHGADLDNGRRLYLDPTLGGGTAGKCCFTCHEQGRDLPADLGRRTSFPLMGNTMGKLADVVNSCIEMALRGQGLDPQSKEMTDLIAYLTWLGKSQHDPALPATGCTR